MSDIHSTPPSSPVAKPQDEPRRSPASEGGPAAGLPSDVSAKALATAEALAKDGNITDAEREELRRHGILMTSLEELYGWGRSNSIWPLQFGLACCAIEMIAAATARFDIARFGAEIFRPSPRQADLMIVSGTVTKKMAPQVVRLWNQMPEPKYCIAMGACAISGGPFKQGYNVLKGIDRFIPVDIYIPGCPPRPEALLNGLIQLQAKIKGEKLTGPDAARFTRPEEPSEFPVPEYGEHDLVPPKNPAVWSPPAASSGKA